jgi:hypothetical protein
MANQYSVQELNAYGVTFDPRNGSPRMLDSASKRKFAMDESLTTNANSGLLPLAQQWIDPDIIDVLFSPMYLTKYLPEVQKGDWTTTDAIFPIAESAGKPTTYGDFNDNGSTSINVNFMNRQPYLYQQTIEVGDLAQAKYGNAKISYLQEMQRTCVLSLNKLQHNIYAYGVAGLENYGMLNDPNLNAPLTGVDWSTATNIQIMNDIRKLYTQLVKQTNGLVEQEDKLLLLLSPTQKSHLTAVNDYNESAWSLIKGQFPELEIGGIPEYTTSSGEYMQMILPQYLGSDNVQLGYNTKMHVGNIVTELSGFKQKRSQGSYGAIIKRPAFISTMLTAQSNSAN